MKYLFLLILAAGCTQQKTDVTGYYQGYQRGWKDAQFDSIEESYEDCEPTDEDEGAE